MARTPSLKAIQATQLIVKGMSPTEAMRRAGYSKSTIKNPKANLLSRPGVLNIIDRMNLTLEAEGITADYLAFRLAELAKSDNTKDFLSGYDRIKEIKKIGIKEEIEPNRKTTLTLEEWLGDKD